MALRGVAPKNVQKRLKMFLFGEAKVGKSTLASDFPKTYYIDTERGVENEQYISRLQANDSRLFSTTDLDDIIQETFNLLSEPHPYRTLVIDSLTFAYNEELDKSAKSLITDEDKTGTGWGRHKTLPDRKIKHLMNLLVRLDMNVIITSHAKMQYGDGMTKLGNTYDCYSKLDYLFDLILEVSRRGIDNRVVTVKGSRCEQLKENSVLPASYAALADAYGRMQIERDSIPENLATPAQVTELKGMCHVLKVSEETVDKWLTKARATNFYEFTQDQIQKCISHCAAMVVSAVNPQQQLEKASA